MESIRIVGLTIAVCLGLASPAYASATMDIPLKFSNITIEQAWARLATTEGENSGKIYLTIHNRSDADDYLLAVDSRNSASSMIHAANQQPVPGGLTMPSHGEVVMRPNGFHIMLTGVSAKVKPGGVLPVRVILRDAGSFDLSVPILEQDASDPPIEHKGHGT